MKASRIVFVVVAAVATALLMFSSTSAQQQPAAKAGQPTAVAVCDIEEVNSKYEKTKMLVGTSRDRINELEKEFKARGDKIDAIRKDLEGGFLKAGSPEYEKTMNDLQKSAIELEAWRKFQEALIVREKFRLTKEIYTDIVKVVGDVARSKGIQLVLYRNTGNVDGRDLGELISDMERRKVLYWDNNVDITNDVLNQVNQNYKNNPAGNNK